MQAWSKTQKEIDRGTAWRYDSLDDFRNVFGPDLIIEVRRVILERHGNAIEWKVRLIDDFKAGLQNTACSYCCVHRPATHDDLVAQVMAVRQVHPRILIHLWTSGFAQAYRQIAQEPSQMAYTIVAQWCPDDRRTVFITSVG